MTVFKIASEFLVLVKDICICIQKEFLQYFLYLGKKTNSLIHLQYITMSKGIILFLFNARQLNIN